MNQTKIPFNKPKLITEKTLKPFVWNRILIDLTTKQVVNSDQTGINELWKGKFSIWKDVPEF
jgi:hypothetical protein